MYEQTIQRTIEKLYEDECLRANLTDGEAKIVFEWAAAWIQQRVSTALTAAQAEQIAHQEYKRVMQKLGMLNTLKPNPLRLADAFNVLEPELKANQPLPREQVLKLITELMSVTWRMQLPRTDPPAPIKKPPTKTPAL